jgi:hypothetical protein
MSEPRRLQEESGSDLELMLLRSARDDQPTPQSRRRTLEALGLAGGIVGVGATVTTTTAASTAIATASNLAILQWISVGIMAGILAVGGIDQITRGESPPERRPASPSRVEQPARAPIAPAGRSALDHAAGSAAAGSPVARGLLSPEAMLLRIEATLARGDRAGAIRLANEFLAAHPRSAHTSRVRSVLAAAQAQP